MDKKTCRFLDERRDTCYALNTLQNGKKPSCVACSFYQTLDEKLKKDAKVYEWYNDRGMNYQKRVADFGYDKN